MSVTKKKKKGKPYLTNSVGICFMIALNIVLFSKDITSMNIEYGSIRRRYIHLIRKGSKEVDMFTFPNLIRNNPTLKKRLRSIMPTFMTKTHRFEIFV